MIKSAWEVYLTFALFVIISSCRKDCHDFSNTTESCDYGNLVVCDSTLDLKKYVIRKDESYTVGSARAIKSVKTKGEIEWVANNRAAKFTPDDFFLSMSTFADTSWIGLESWAYHRETIFTKLNPYDNNIQKIYSESEYKLDTTLTYSWYKTYADDLVDSKWAIDPLKDNYIIVTTLDTVEKFIEGEFNLNFKLTHESMYRVDYIPRVRFKCGRFRALIVQ